MASLSCLAVALLGSISTVNVARSTRTKAAWSTAFRAFVTAPAQRAQVMSLTWNAIMASGGARPFRGSLSAAMGDSEPGELGGLSRQSSRLPRSVTLRPGEDGPSSAMHSLPPSCRTITNERSGRGSLAGNTAST